MSDRVNQIDLKIIEGNHANDSNEIPKEERKLKIGGTEESDGVIKCSYVVGKEGSIEKRDLLNITRGRDSD
jgi:hypothetical protein